MNDTQATETVELGPGGAVVDPPVTGRQLALALGAGLLAAVAVPGAVPGLGMALSGLAVAAVVLAGRPLDTWWSPWRGALVACAVAIAPLPALSDALWVVFPSLLVGVALAVVGLGGGSRWLGLLRPLLRVVPGGFRAVGVVAREVRAAVPVGERKRPALRATVVTVVLLGVFGALFASADRVFGRLVERYLVPDLDLGLLPARVVLLAVVTLGVVTVMRVRARPRDDRPLPPASRPLTGVEWQVPLAGLVALFAAFVALQFGVLFGGHEQVLHTAGLTYAEYARGGFGQLLVVAVLTLAVIAGAARYAPTAGREARLQRVLLAALCLLTLVVLASAFHRLAVYEEAFGFTRLRFAAQVAIWWLAAVFGLVLLAGAAGRERLLPRAIVLLTALVVVGVGHAQPDGLIARRNVERYAAEDTLDLQHLVSLSADAVPALQALPPDVRGCVFDVYAARLDPLRDDGGWAGWNHSRARAVDLLDDTGDAASCT